MSVVEAPQLGSEYPGCGRELLQVIVKPFRVVPDERPDHVAGVEGGNRLGDADAEKGLLGRGHAAAVCIEDVQRRPEHVEGAVFSGSRHALIVPAPATAGKPVTALEQAEVCQACGRPYLIFEGHDCPGRRSPLHLLRKETVR